MVEKVVSLFLAHFSIHFHCEALHCVYVDHKTAVAVLYIAVYHSLNYHSLNSMFNGHLDAALQGGRIVSELEEHLLCEEYW